jgi:hypothetical protein
MRGAAETRRRLRRGIADEEFVTVVAILARMAANPEANEQE